MKHIVVIALIFGSTLACNESQKPEIGEIEALGVVLVFPNLEVFERLDGWDALGAEAQHSREVDLLRWIDEMPEDYGEPEAASSATPGATKPRYRACQLLPDSMQALGTRLGDGSWTSDDRDFANHVAQLAAYIDPTAKFDFDQAEHPTAELQRLISWFETQAAETRTLGLMVSSMFAGPWFPREAPADLDLSINSSKSLPGGLELELGYREDGTWCMRGRSGDDVQWVRDLGMPADQAVSFEDADPVDLGPYGWRLKMTFGDVANFYVSKSGEALFYFTSF